jgi:hypothetical protein
MTRSKSRARAVKPMNLANNSVTSLYAKRAKLENGNDSTENPPTTNNDAAAKTLTLKSKPKARGFGDANKVILELNASIPKIGFKDFGGCEDQLLVRFNHYNPAIINHFLGSLSFIRTFKAS